LRIISQNNSHFKKRKRWKIGGKVGKNGEKWGKIRYSVLDTSYFKGLKLFLPHFS
jgi:hypothetical protein